MLQRSEQTPQIFYHSVAEARPTSMRKTPRDAEGNHGKDDQKCHIVPATAEGDLDLDRGNAEQKGGGKSEPAVSARPGNRIGDQLYPLQMRSIGMQARSTPASANTAVAAVPN